MRLYLDVDGTLLRRCTHPGPRGLLTPAEHLRSFLDWATGRFDCMWLTSHDRSGGNEAIRAIFRQAIGPGDEADAIDALLCQVAPSQWHGCKARGIDFSSPFLWLDDAPEEESLDLLAAHGAQDCWIPIALDQCPADLGRVMVQLQQRAVMAAR